MSELSINDVAKAAGVHSSTVSRAFTRPEAVNAVTRERVLRIAEEMGYRVNPLGQALRRRASMLVPLVVPDITNPFYGELAKAIAAAAGPRGYQLVLCVTEGVPGQTSSFIASMDAMFSPFAIVAPSTKLDVAALGKAALAKRLIVIDRVPPELDVPTVFIDNRLGVRLSFEHLRELGHRDIAYLTGTVGTYSGQERLDEFRVLAKAERLTPVVLNGGYGPEAGRAAAEQFLALPSRPTAVIASNDMAAFGFMSQVSERGVRIPEDLSVTGFDGVAIGATFNPAITTVAQPLAELGRRAIEVAERFVSTGVIEHELLVPEMLIRRSTRRLE